MSASDIDWVRASRAALALALGSDMQMDVPTSHIVRAARFHGLSAEVHDTAVVAGHQDLVDALSSANTSLLMAGMARLAAAMRIVTVLREAGIGAIGIKGIGLAAQTRSRPLSRPSSDIDLLIEPSNVLRAHAALTAAGGVLGDRFPVPAETAVFAAVTRLRQEASYQIFDHSLDLHWHLGLARHLLPPSSAALDRATEVSVAGAQWPTLSVPDALVHSAIHWQAAGFVRLKYVLDIEALVPQQSPSELRNLPRAVKDVIAVSHGLASSTQTWNPRTWVPQRSWRLAMRALTPPTHGENSLRRRSSGFMTQLRGTPDPRDRAMLPVRAAIGPVARQYERLTGVR